MLGVGNDIVEPNLMGKKLDGEKLSKLFSQKCVAFARKRFIRQQPASYH